MKGGSKLQYWRARKEYDVLNGSGRRKFKMEVATLGSGSAEKPNKKPVSWRVKIKRKIRFFCFRAPKKFLTSIRDGYVKMMIKLSTSRVVAGGLGGCAGNASNGYGFTNPTIKEYDEKVIVEIYKAMIVREQLVPESKSAQVIVRRS